MTTIDRIVSILEKATKAMSRPLIDKIIDEFGRDPFLILIACLLSLRARDTVTIRVCRELFALALTPEEILNIPQLRLEKILFRLGFYRVKARVITTVSQTILKKYNGKVPATYKELSEIKGVGPKTANLVLSMAFGKSAICVDVHVHRISNRLGLIKTKTPEQTEDALKKILSVKYWNRWNTLLVTWGQQVCKPLRPCCAQCVLNIVCQKVF